MANDGRGLIMSVPDANLYEISRLLYDLRNPANRDAVCADAEAYYRRYAVGEDAMRLLTHRDWQGLVDIGVTVYLLTKLGAALSVTLLEMGAAMRSMSNEDFQRFIEKQNRSNRAMALLPDDTHPEKA